MQQVVSTSLHRVAKSWRRLYDLSHTCFEAEAAANLKARYGRSKEKRTDCPRGTLSLVVDGSGCMRTRRASGVTTSLTTSLTLKDGCTLHVRKRTTAELASMAIDQALNLSSAPGGTRNWLV